MAEKILGQIAFIETEDGFRVEIKGDKDRIRKMGFPPDPEAWKEMGFGPEHWQRHFRPRGGWRFGMRRPKHFGGFGPWMCGWGFWDNEEDEDYDDTPPKEAQ